MSSSLSPDQRKALVRSYIETAWNTIETDESSEAVGHSASEENVHPQSDSCSSAIASPTCVYLGTQRLSLPIAQVRKAVRKTFPDIHLTITDLLIEEEKVAARWVMQGTDLGGYEGHLPTGRVVQITGMTMIHLEQNVIVEEWNEVDIAGLRQQLGFVYTSQPPRVTIKRPRPAQPS